MVKLKPQILKTDQDRLKHLAALSRLMANDEHAEVFTHLYECLTILDQKLSALLSFNSIIIAVFTLLIINPQENLFVSLFLYIGLFSILVSCLLLLLVARVHWSTTHDFENVKNHGLTLLGIRKSRTFKYRLAWCFSIASVLLLFCFSFIYFLFSLDLFRFD